MHLHQVNGVFTQKGVQMSQVAIVTDSTATIPDEMLSALHIHWVPYYIHRGNETLRDLVTIKREEFYRWLKVARELPKTANPGPGDYETIYEKIATEEGATDIVSIHMTSKSSGAYQAATIGRAAILERLPQLRIEVVDTLNVSMCHGWAVIEAARDAVQGKSIDQILSKINQIIPKVQMIQTADTLKYLAMGGRIGKATSLLGSLLNIKPLIGMRDGVIVPLGKAFTRANAYKMMVESVLKTVGEKGKVKIAYVHAAAKEEVLEIKALMGDRIQVIEEIIVELPPALGVHSGPGTAGICFYPVEDGELAG
jgi:DegV family protein with EDD domain